MQQGHIPIVQGHAVPNTGGYSQPTQYPSQGGGYAQAADRTYQASGTSYQPTGGNNSAYAPQSDFNGVKGESQPKQFQDGIWAILFGVHLAVMVVIMIVQSTSLESSGYNYSGVVWCVSVCAVVAVILSSMALGFMMQFATELVKMALFFSIGCSLAMGIMGALAGQMWMSIMGFASFALGCCYAYFVWSRIPFAAANLRTALTAVKVNLGLVAVAYFFLALAFGWSLWWSVTAGTTVSTVGSAALFFFLLSYYWVHQVLQNTVHVTTAGVIGTWWFVPEEASTCWSSAIMDSLGRATTYSFGSICFGSFLVALVQALRAMHRIAHQNDDCSFVICIIDCILGCIQGIIEYLNKWAYVYVGLYGYSYLEAGRNVITLFQNKGWSTLITDDLAENVLFMVSVAIGLITGLVGFIMGKIDQNLFAGMGYDDSGMVGFVLGFLVGFLFASIMMSVVASAVNTVIVCFAEAPAEFQANHPELSNDMRMAWRQAWPMECGQL